MIILKNNITKQYFIDINMELCNNSIELNNWKDAEMVVV